MKSLFIFLVLVIGCGKDGRDGEPGKAGLRGANGEKGADGINGTAGKDGSDNRIIATLYCNGNISKSLGKASGLELPEGGLNFDYNAAKTASGDVFVSGSISDRYYQVSAAHMYAASQNGAASGALSMVDDRAATYNSGWWSIEHSPSVNDLLATYHDVDLSSDKIFTFNTCTAHTY